MKCSRLVSLPLIFFTQIATATEWTLQGEKSLDFKVFLDDREVGRHQFELLGQGESVQVSSAMSLDFKVLLVKQVTYVHQANEVWESGCLVSVQSETEKLGKRSVVDARMEKSGLQVGRDLEGKLEQETIGGCVRGFAYWNPHWLQPAEPGNTSLLNAETGINIPVVVSSRVSEPDKITHMQIVLPKGQIDLQYDAAGEWLSLKTKLRIGGTLRYQRVFDQVDKLPERAEQDDYQVRQ